MSSTTKRTCTATNKRGERCSARALERGLCAAHAGLVDMQAIGRKGGKVSPQTRLRKSADDDLRELARQTLEKALRGQQVDKAQLDAARSLFSYRADQPPPRDPELGEYAGPLMPDGRRPISLGDVLEFAMGANASTRAVAEAWIAQAQRVPPPKVSKESRSNSGTGTGADAPLPPQPEPVQESRDPVAESWASFDEDEAKWREQQNGGAA